MSYEKNRLLIQTLRECVEACNYCFQACLKEENVKMMVECIRLDRECADMCAFLERELTIDSSFAHDLFVIQQSEFSEKIQSSKIKWKIK